MTMRLAGVALATMAGACAMSGGQKAEAATVVNVSASGEYNDGEFNFSGFFIVDTKFSRIDLSYDRTLDDPVSFSDQYTNFESKLFYYDDEFNLCNPNQGCSNIELTFGNNYYVLASADGSGFRVTDVTTPSSFGTVQLQDGGALTISVVPLPASTPLLGAALLALGGIGYARRRTAKAP